MEMGGTYTKERPLKCDPPSLGLEPAREDETRTPQADMEAEHYGRVKEDQSDMGNSRDMPRTMENGGRLLWHYAAQGVQRIRSSKSKHFT